MQLDISPDNVSDQISFHVTNFALLIIPAQIDQVINLRGLLICDDKVISGRGLISVLVVFLVIPPLPTYFLSLEFLLPLVLTQDPGCFHPNIKTPLVPAELTVLPCPERDGAVLVLDTAVGHIVATLD